MRRHRFQDLYDYRTFRGKRYFFRKFDNGGCLDLISIEGPRGSFGS
jgi:hypothetical protein